MDCRILRVAALSACLGAALPAAVAQPKLSSNEVVFTSGNWQVVRTTRARSDTVRCNGFYKSERTVQLTADSLIIKATDVQQVVVRFDDELSLPARPPTEPEKSIGAVVLTGPDFDKLLTHKKLAVEISAPQGRTGVLLRLQGMPEALANIKAGCPAGSDAGPQTCSDPLRARMKAAGVTEDQVLRICR